MPSVKSAKQASDASAAEEPPVKRNRVAAEQEADDESTDDPVLICRPPEFNIKLDMKGQKGLGLDVDWGDGKTLFIKGVKAEGAVCEWNKTCAPHLVVSGGDRVFAINDREGNPKAMLAECRSKTLLNLSVRTGTGSAAPAKTEGTVQRPSEFAIKLDMTGKAGLGLDVDWSDGKTLYVKYVKPEGAIADWNKTASPNEVVQLGDRVVAINDKNNDPKTMLAECRAKQRLKLVIRTNMPGIGVKPKDPAVAKAEAAKMSNVPKCHEFNVLVDMTRQNILGVDVDWTDGKTLYIISVQRGAIQDWNNVNPIYQQVSAGDRIVSVNGYSDDPESMASLCKELSMAQCQFEMKIRGPPPMPKLPPAPPEEDEHKEKNEKRDKRDKDEKRERRDRKRDDSDEG